MRPSTSPNETACTLPARQFGELSRLTGTIPTQCAVPYRQATHAPCPPWTRSGVTFSRAVAGGSCPEWTVGLTGDTPGRCGIASRLVAAVFGCVIGTVYGVGWVGPVTVLAEADRPAPQRGCAARPWLP